MAVQLFNHSTFQLARSRDPRDPADGGFIETALPSHDSPTNIFIPCYDNNGNIRGYWDEQGNVVAGCTDAAFASTGIVNPENLSRQG